MISSDTLDHNSRIKLLTSTEYHDLYGAPNFSDEDRAHFFSLSFSDQKLLASFKHLQDKVYYLLSLGYFRAKQSYIYFTLNQIIVDRRYLMQHYFQDHKTPKKSPSAAQKNRIQNKILEQEKFLRWNPSLQKSVEHALAKLVRSHPKARPLTKALLHHFSHHRIALPAYSTLQRLVSKALSDEHKRLFQICKRILSIKERLVIDQMLTQEEKLYPISQIRQDSRDFSYSELSKEIKKHDLLKPLFSMSISVINASELPAKTIDHYGSLVNFYSVYKLRRMQDTQAQWYLLCYSFRRYQKINDNLIQFFQHHVNHLHEAANHYSTEQLVKQYHDMSESLAKTGEILQLFTEDEQENIVKKERAFQILPLNQMPKVQEYLLGHTRDELAFYWADIDSKTHEMRLYLRPLFSTIEFSVSEEPELDSLITCMKEFLQNPKNFPKSDPRLISFIPKKLKAYLLDPADNVLRQIRFEFFFYHSLFTKIKTKKLHFSNSLHYKSLKEELIHEAVWEKEKTTILHDLGYLKLITPIERILADYRQQLDPLIISVNQRIQSGENTSVVLKQKKTGVHWALPYHKKIKSADNPFFLQLPQVNIVDVLYFVNQQCGFLNAFTDIQGYSIKQKRSDPLVLAAILGNAIRLGSYKMASTAHLNLQELLTAEKTYFRLETLHDAIDLINNRTAELPIFPFWNIYGKLHSSLDGSKINTRRHILKARYSPKYHGLGVGVASYNLITNHLPINAYLIGSHQHESHFSFPLVFNNTSLIHPRQHSGDGHSINQINFSLFDMIEHRYMPHFPSIQKKSIFCFEDLKQYDDCIIKPTQQIRDPLICSEWPTIQHIYASILKGETDQSAVIQILASHDYHSRTKEALWEYDGIVKSLYLLNYIDNVEMRQAVRAALNRGEAYHQLCRAIAFMNAGRFRGITEVELAIWNECARLVASATLFYNAYILSLLFEQIKDDQLREILIRLSPVAWGHLNFLGQYEFDRQNLILEIEKWLKNIKIDSPEFIY